MKTRDIIIGILLATLIAGCSANTSPQQPPQMLAALPPPSPHLAPARIGPADIYPPPWATGAINQDITQENIAENICNPHWSTKSERPPARYTTALKIKQLKELGYEDQKTADYEEDHLISLELGGNPTDTNNLWPEAYNASLANGGARYKDKVENYLHDQVCAGNMTLKGAQTLIVTDWYKVYQQGVEPQLGAVEGIDANDE